MSDQQRCFIGDMHTLPPFAQYQQALQAVAEACVATNKALEQLSLARDALITAWQHQHAEADQ
jgi:hypothetical protein